MCINLKTSLCAFLIGTISALTMQYNKSTEIVLLGQFIGFFTLVQLFEALKYKFGEKYKFISHMILLNLFFQGFVFFSIMSKKNIVGIEYKLLTLIIGLLGVHYMITNNVSVELQQKLNCIDKTGCLSWNFLNDKQIYIPLGAMYIIMFIWLFSSKNIKFIRAGFLLLFTFIYSKYIGNFSNKASFWCMTSAFLSPLFLML